MGFDGNFDGSTDAGGIVTDGKFTFTATSSDYENDIYPPGEYKVTIKGTSVDSGDERITTVSITIIDPCNPPDSIAAPGYVDQSYVLT